MEGKERSVVMAWYWFLSPKKRRKVADTACHQNILKTFGVCLYRTSWKLLGYDAAGVR